MMAVVPLFGRIPKYQDAGIQCVVVIQVEMELFRLSPANAPNVTGFMLIFWNTSPNDINMIGFNKRKLGNMDWLHVYAVG